MSHLCLSSTAQGLVHNEPTFSLLHYSFNLNPTLRQQIAAELHDLVSAYELRRIVTTTTPTRASDVDSERRRAESHNISTRSCRSAFVDALPVGSVTSKVKQLASSLPVGASLKNFAGSEGAAHDHARRLDSPPPKRSHRRIGIFARTPSSAPVRNNSGTRSSDSVVAPSSMPEGSSLDMEMSRKKSK